MKFLLLAYEGEARSMGALAARLKEGGHQIFIACVDHFFVTHARGENLDHLRSLGLTEDEFTNLDSVYRAINSYPPDMPRAAIDWDYLRGFEKRYCRQFALLQMAAMDPLMLRLFHHRSYYHHPKNKNLLIKNIELHLRWLEDVFARGPFDFIVSIDFQYFLKAAAYTMSRALGVPYLMIAGCRIRDLHLIFDNFALGTPRHIAQEMARLEREGAPCAEAASFIEQTRAAGAPAYAGHAATDANIAARLNLRNRIREIVRFIYRYPKKAIFSDRHYRGPLKPNYFLPSYFGQLHVLLTGLWRRIRYFRHASLNATALPDGPFVYFPMQLLPENSVLTLSDTFNELECIFQLSKVLPADWRVVVKINPAMLFDTDTHPTRYYLDIAKLPNVQFVSPLVPSAAILKRASAVACISGTALLEGAIYGIPGIRWGQTEFEIVDTISKFDAAEVRRVLAQAPSKNLKYYVHACLNRGIPLDLRLLNHTVPEQRTPEQRRQVDSEIEKLERFLLDHIAQTNAGGAVPKAAAAC